MYWLYARAEIRSVGDLKGKKVGVSVSAAAPTLLRDVLKKQGLEGGRDDR